MLPSLSQLPICAPGPGALERDFRRNTTAGRAGKTLDQELARVVRDHAAPVGTKQAAGRPVRPVRRMDT